VSKKRKPRKVYGEKHKYLTDESKLLLLVSLCIQYALDYSTKAKEVYESILEAWGRPGCLPLLKSQVQIPKTELLAWERAATSGSKYKPKDIELKLPQDFDIDNKDYKALKLLIAEFIRVGFNRRINAHDYNEKVTYEKSVYLALAVTLISATTYVERHPDLGIDTAIKIGDRELPLYLLNGVSQERVHRARVRRLRRYGYKLNHDKKLKNMAWRWYQCRVVYSSIEEYSTKHFISTTDKRLDTTNLSKEISLVDKATGYPRRQPGRSV
jgi:hypothetical protein